MNRIDVKFRELKRSKKKAFIAFITAGYPSLAATGKLICELERSGVDIIELGVPFSDPLADGTTIQRASERSLKNGTRLLDIICLTKSIRRTCKIPIVLMSYFNPIYAYGLKRFVKDAHNSGVDGVIISDMPPEESGELSGYAAQYDFAMIFLAAPTSTAKRLALIAKASKGFIYYVSLTGVTGARKELPKDIAAGLRRIKTLTRKPLCVGFGISTPKQAEALSKIADGIIVGSAIVKVIEANIGSKNLVSRVGKFVKGFADICHKH